MEPQELRSQRLLCLVALIAMTLSAIVLARIWSGWRSHQVPVESSLMLTLDPNTASWEELACLPQLGPSAAKAIVAYRQQQQTSGTARPFSSDADLDKVAGIGPATLEEIRPHLHFR